MNLKVLTPTLSVTPQISEGDVAELKQRGYKSIISNRPEGESPDQPSWDEIQAAAAGCGLEARHIPVVMGQLSDGDVVEFRRALKELPKPIAAFCRTGTRSTLLWALVNEASLTADERVRIAAEQGYDLEPFRARLEQPQ